MLRRVKINVAKSYVRGQREPTAQALQVDPF